MKIVTGHRGFIGGRLYNRLKESEEVVGIEIEDWRNPLEIERLVSQCDGVYHIGANSSTTYSNPDIFTTNFFYSTQLLKWCKAYNVKMVFASSAAAFGTFGLPENFYAWTKVCTEKVGAEYDSFVALRYYNVYGPDESHKGKMASIAYQAYVHYQKTGEPFKLFTGRPMRDFIYVDDVVNATIWAMACSWSKPWYEVGTGVASSFEEVLDGMEIPYEYYTEGESNQRKPHGYQEWTKADSNHMLPEWSSRCELSMGTLLYRRYLDVQTNNNK